MEFFLQAYEVYEIHKDYEARIARREFNARLLQERSPFRATLETSLGDFMIQVGLKLKKHASAGKSMVWSPVTGSEA